MANTYITTSLGFIKDVIVTYDNEEKSKKVDIIYTDKIMHARAFNSAGAAKYIKLHNLFGFIYKPYEQEHVSNMYRVRKRNKYNYDSNQSIGVDEYIVEKAVMCNDSDAAFLGHRGGKKIVEIEGLMILEEAEREALRLNTIMANELNEKIKKQVEAIGKQRYELQDETQYKRL